MPVAKQVTFPVYKGNHRDVNQLQPLALESLKLVLAECVKRGIQIFVYWAFRSAAEQHQEFLEGHSKLDSGHSMHEFRLAVDVGCKGKDLYNQKTLLAAAAIFKSHNWLWGGDWDNDGKTEDEIFRDWAHFQFVSIAEQKTIYKLKTPQAINDYLVKRGKK